MINPEIAEKNLRGVLSRFKTDFVLLALEKAHSQASFFN